MSVEENTEKAPAQQAKPEKKQLWADIDYQEAPDSHSPYTTLSSPVQATAREPVKTFKNPRRPQNTLDQTRDFNSDWGRSHPRTKPANEPHHQSGQFHDHSSPRQRHPRASPHQRHVPQATTATSSTHQTHHDTDLIRNQPTIMSENAAKKAEEIRQRNAREEEERRLNCLRLLKQLDEKKLSAAAVIEKVESAPVIKKDEAAPVIKKDESAPVIKKDESAPVIKKDESAPVIKKVESAPVIKKDESAPATQSIEFKIPLRSSTKKKPATPPRTTTTTTTTTTTAVNEAKTPKPITPTNPSDTQIIFKVPITRDAATEAPTQHKPQTKQQTPQMIYRRKQDTSTSSSSSDTKADSAAPPSPPSSPSVPSSASTTMKSGGDVIVQEMRIRIAPDRSRPGRNQHRPRSAAE